MRARKYSWSWWSLTALAAALFLSVQLLFLSYNIDQYLKKGQNADSKTKNIRQERTILEVIEEFSTEALKCGLRLFVIDKKILSDLAEGNWHSTDLSFVSLAAIATPDLQFVTFETALPDCEFAWRSLPAHLLLSWSSSDGVQHIVCSRHPQSVPSGPEITIHVVLLYDSAATDNEKGGFLWQGQLEPATTKFSHVAGNNFRLNVQYGHQQGSFERFEVRPAAVSEGTILLQLPADIESFLMQAEASRFLPCNYSRAVVFYESFDKSEDAKTLLFKDLARRVIVHGKQILDDLDIQFWISSGTLLGWYRQCDIIEHTTDVDFAVPISNFTPNIIGAFKRQGFHFKHKFGKVEDSLELSFVKDGVKLDIFFFYESGDFVWNGGTHAETGQKYKYSFHKFALCRAELLSVHVRVPCDTHTYILSNYGGDWWKPVKEWKWNESPPNVRENGKWNEHELSQVIQVY